MPYTDVLDTVQEAKLNAWLATKIEEAKVAGEEMFMGIPDKWFEGDNYHCCNQGHISRTYLKSELKGSLCLRCYQPSHIFPSDATQEDLNNALK